MNALDQTVTPHFAAYQGDCVEVIAGIPDNSIHYSVSSPPFRGLFIYGDSERDFGNCKDTAEFNEHMTFLLREMLRIMMPGRCMSMHVMDLPTSKVRDGMIGLSDFPGDVIRAAQSVGWVWASKVTIWKCPVVAAQRTKAIGLLYKQLRKDSCMSRMGIPDYVLTFRKPGENPEPVTHTYETFPLTQWQKWAEPIWMDIDPGDTLQHRSAREDADERHIAPLQLEVIRRCIRMWSNPGDTVFTPFLGIGSEAYVAIEEGRRGCGVELKKSYYQQAVRNLLSVSPGARGQQVDLFAGAAK